MGWAVGSLWENKPTCCWPCPVLNCFGLSLSKSDSPGSSLWELGQLSLTVGTRVKFPFYLGFRLARFSSAGMSKTCVLTERFLLSQTMSKSVLCSVTPEGITEKHTYPHTHTPHTHPDFLGCGVRKVRDLPPEGKKLVFNVTQGTCFSQIIKAQHSLERHRFGNVEKVCSRLG